MIVLEASQDNRAPERFRKTSMIRLSYNAPIWIYPWSGTTVSLSVFQWTWSNIRPKIPLPHWSMSLLNLMIHGAGALWCLWTCRDHASKRVKGTRPWWKCGQWHPALWMTLWISSLWSLWSCNKAKEPTSPLSSPQSSHFQKIGTSSRS